LEVSFDRLLITPPSHFCPQKVEVWLLSLLAYREDDDDAMKKYSFANGLSRGKLPPHMPPQGAPIFWPKLLISV
jgi:hypothetical protein